MVNTEPIVSGIFNYTIYLSFMYTFYLVLIYLHEYRVILPLFLWISIDAYMCYFIKHEYKLYYNNSFVQTCVNTIHAGFTSFSTILYLCNILPEWMYIEMLVISFVYLCYDFFLLMISDMNSKMKKQLLFHHAVVLTNMLPIFIESFQIIHNYWYLSSILYLSEIPTIPLNISWTLNDLKKTDTLLFKYSSLATIILYIPCRLFTSVYVFYMLYKDSYFNSFMFFTGIFIILNYYWFYKLVSRFYSSTIIIRR
jgi:hypothetical protein